MGDPFRYLISALLGLAIASTPALAVEKKVHIRLKPRAEVAEQEVRLGDVADITGGPQTFKGVLRDVVLGPSPPLGKNKVLSSYSLTSRLRRQKIELEDLEIEGPRYVRVYREAQEVSEPEIRAMVMSYIKTHLHHKRGRVTLRRFSVRGNRTIPKGETTYKIVPPRRPRLAGNTNFQLIVEVDGEVATKLWVLVEIDITGSAVTAIRFLPRGHVLKAHDLVVAEASLGNAADATFQEISKVVGKRLIKSVNKGELLLSNHVQAPRMIRRGTVVTLVVERGPLKVTARGVALEDGEMGRIIRVKNLSSKKTVFATVMDSTTVRVDI